MSKHKRDHPKVLVVEGPADLYSVTGLIKHFVNWPPAPPWPVFIEVAQSVERILEDMYLTTEFKSEPVRTLGVMLDADRHALGRYQRIQQLMSKSIPELPATMPQDGLIVDADSRRFGLWVMPDNRRAGKLEDFLRGLVPPAQENLWTLAEHSVRSALAQGASVRDGDRSNAELYTWLAWQDPPGQQPGFAISQKVLDAHSSHAQPFVNWFRKLFEL